MIVSTNILAEGPDFGWAAWIIGLIVVGIVRAVMKKTQAAKEEQERQQSSARRQPDGQQPQPESRYRPLQQAEPPPPPAPKTDPLMRAMENLGIVQELPPDPPPPPPPDNRAHREKKREAKLEAERRARRTTQKVAPEHTAGVAERLAQPRSAAEARYRRPSVTRGELANADAARQALIYHEIFSPPKALRDVPEIWDL